MEISVLARFSGALHILFGGAPGVLVRRRRLLPVSQPRENMRRHVLSVGDGSSRFGVGSCCLETICGMFWIIVYVNQVVQDTRMLQDSLRTLPQRAWPLQPVSQILAAFFDRARIESP